jgi:hypothetical protein
MCDTKLLLSNVEKPCAWRHTWRWRLPFQQISISATLAVILRQNLLLHPLACRKSPTTRPCSLSWKTECYASTPGRGERVWKCRYRQNFDAFALHEAWRSWKCRQRRYTSPVSSVTASHSGLDAIVSLATIQREYQCKPLPCSDVTFRNLHTGRGWKWKENPYLSS